MAMAIRFNRPLLPIPAESANTIITSQTVEPLNAPKRPGMVNTGSVIIPTLRNTASVRIIRDEAPRTTTQSAKAPVRSRTITARNTPAYTKDAAERTESSPNFIEQART